MFSIAKHLQSVTTRYFAGRQRVTAVHPNENASATPFTIHNFPLTIYNSYTSSLLTTRPPWLADA